MPPRTASAKAAYRTVMWPKCCDTRAGPAGNIGNTRWFKIKWQVLSCSAAYTTSASSPALSLNDVQGHETLSELCRRRCSMRTGFLMGFLGWDFQSEREWKSLCPPNNKRLVDECFCCLNRNQRWSGINMYCMSCHVWSKLLLSSPWELCLY